MHKKNLTQTFFSSLLILVMIGISVLSFLALPVQNTHLLAKAQGLAQAGILAAQPAASTTVSFGDGLQAPGTGKGLTGDTTEIKSDPLASIELFISRIIGALTVLGGVFFVVYFVLGAFGWVTAGGDQSKIQKARDQMVQGFLGLVVIVISYGLLGVIGTAIGLNLLTPAESLTTIFNL